MLLDLWPNLHSPRFPNGWHPVPEHNLRGRTRLRYTLTILSSGALEHSQPVVIDNEIITAGHARAATLISQQLEETSRAGVRARSTETCHVDTTARVEDPDEWVVLNDPNLT